MKYFVIALFAAVLVIAAASTSRAGEYHSGGTLLCYDCHTAHFSMQHGFDGGTVGNTPASGGNWLGSTGPNQFLLKAPVNELCKGCHDGQTFAPDVFAANFNASPTQGRQAGALNDAGAGAPYDQYKGHTLDSTATPPGYAPANLGLTDWYDAAGGLECVSCHAQHGPATAYRNLGPYALGAAASNFRPTYVISGTNNTNQDVWINLASYTAGNGNAATFNPYYDRANISFNRLNLPAVGTTNSSNRLDTFCGACHGNFHGGPGDANIGATSGALDGFIRHPTSQVTIGAAGAQGYGGHSSLTRFQANTAKVKVYASQTNYSDASPGCITCHKGHGNQNPFGLIFLSRNAASVDEQGGWGASDTPSLQQGYRNLCGQCHGQGA